MAFYNKLSSLVTRRILKSSAETRPVQVMQMLIPTRRLSSTKLFIGGLSFGTDDQQLKEAFSGFGSVTEARVILDRETGKSRGFGFVHFESDEDASTALSSLNGQELNGRAIRITYANDDRRPVRSAGGYANRGNGGYGGGSGGQSEF